MTISAMHLHTSSVPLSSGHRLCLPGSSHPMTQAACQSSCSCVHMGCSPRGLACRLPLLLPFPGVHRAVLHPHLDVDAPVLLPLRLPGPGALHGMGGMLPEGKWCCLGRCLGCCVVPGPTRCTTPPLLDRPSLPSCSPPARCSSSSSSPVRRSPSCWPTSSSAPVSTGCLPADCA